MVQLNSRLRIVPHTKISISISNSLASCYVQVTPPSSRRAFLAFAHSTYKVTDNKAIQSPLHPTPQTSDITQQRLLRAHRVSAGGKEKTWGFYYHKPEWNWVAWRRKCNSNQLVTVTRKYRDSGAFKVAYPENCPDTCRWTRHRDPKPTMKDLGILIAIDWDWQQNELRWDSTRCWQNCHRNRSSL